MSKKSSSFVKGAAILGGAGLIVKIIGAVFRIPLTNIIGLEGIARYQVAYPIYAFLVVIATAGLPAAISRMVSERVTVGDYHGAHRVFQTAFKMLLLIGAVATAIMMGLSGLIANLHNMPDARLSLLMIAPSLFFVSLLSAYRGYFQGLQNMTPTALTQIIEQIIKLCAGLYLASLWAPRGIEYGAAGALLGVSISEVCALVFIIGIYNRRKDEIKMLRRQPGGNVYQSQYTNIKREISVIALPVTVAACIMPLVMELDSLIINNLLPTINYSAYNPLTYKENFGLLTGSINPLVNMPAVLSLALSMSLVPAISEARANKNKRTVSTRAGMGFKLATLIGFPCALGFFLLARPILQLLYSSRLTDVQLDVGGQILQIMSIAVLFLTMLQTMTGILQGAGKQNIPLITLAIGAVVKVVLSIVLIRIPSLNINGAAIGTAACYGIAAILNVIAVIKITKPNIKMVSGLLMPVVSSGVMGIVTYLMYKTIFPSLGNTKTTLLCVVGAGIVYVVMLFVTGGIQKEDMAFIPGGRGITRFMNKLGFWGD